ncbi:Sugar transport protein 5 [Ananas comosus]|uniref:Sugar transport protein 5 n=1 Tax=Ananas comosus TaxID=4615 RepID=A0A199UMY2_ANACO|nr:Sugar transport protein 5 [Ananas comosus]
MDGGGFVVNGPASDYGGGLTFSMIVTCVVAASGGLIFGYDVGVSGGVTTMESFLRLFFPEVLRKMSEAKRDEYCLYDSQKLTAFTSSLYIAGLAASLVAGSLTKAVGRQAILLLGGALFFAGAAVNAAAVNAAPVYLAEVSPPRWRGAFTTGFQFFLLIGVVVASVVNYATARLRRWGWRLSVGLAAAPAALLLLGALLIPDTPSSLLHRGMPDAARAALRRLRGPAADVDAELKDVARAVEDARRNEEGAFARILLQRRYRPHLVMAFAVPLFQQLTGVIVLAFFSPILFQTVGFGSNAALMGAVILAAVDLVAILVSTFTVDRYGRKVLFILGGVQMIISLVAVSWIMGSKIGGNGGATIAKPYATAVVVLLCFFSAAYGWSWGPLGWIIPSEIFPVEIRSAGQGISVAVGLGCTFVQTQTFLAMLCRFKFATFAYYAGWVTLMTVFVAAFLPETRGVPLESMRSIWARHWYWGRFIEDDRNVVEDRT